MSLKVYIQASRPKTLTGAIIPVIAGSALASLEGAISWVLLICALLSATCIQIGTNYINDALDFKKGADTTDRLGPERVTQAGHISYESLLKASAIVFIAAVIFAIPLVLHGGVTILGIGIVSILMAYAYTGGPYPLAYYGLGELFVILFFGVIAVSGTYYLHTLSFSQSALVLGLQIGLLATLLIAINNFRDQEQDKKASKRTLAVRFGKPASRTIVVVSALLPYALGIWWFRQAIPAMILPLLSIPLAVYIAYTFLRIEPSKQCNHFLGKAALLHLLFGFLISLAFLLWR